jgi:hypothetical protein
MWNLTSFCLETMLVSVQDRYMVCAKRTIGSGIVLVHLEIVLTFTQDRCTVCVKCTIGLSSFCMHPMELLGDMGHVESHFFPFGDSDIVDAR